MESELEQDSADDAYEGLLEGEGLVGVLVHAVRVIALQEVCGPENGHH